MAELLSFQYCQKLVVLSSDMSSVLLAQRKGEADYDGVYSFIGGKMETTDESFVAGMQREKEEEIGTDAKICVLANESYNVLFRKSDGNSMVLPHIAGVYKGGKIKLNEEYSDYAWVPLSELDTFEPKIDTVSVAVSWALGRLSVTSESQYTEI